MTVSQLQLPEPLGRRLQEQLGERFDEFVSALSAPAPVSIRLNPGKPSSIEPGVDSVAWSAQGRYLSSRPRFTDDPLFHAGAYYVQEASSMFLEVVVNAVLDRSKDHRVLDLSAAPGGKATHLQSLLTKDSLLVANEVIGSRNKVLRQNLTRWGGDNHIVTQNDPRAFQKLPGFFDLILVDAPCSGEGLIRKDAGALDEWSENNVQLCSSRQKRILSDALPALAEGGVVIYSTCTYSEAENEENMLWLEKEAGLRPIPIDIPDEWGIIKTGKHKTGYRFYPHLTRGEGFFIAAFRKPGSTLPDRNTGKKVNRHAERATTEDSKWLKDVDRYTFVDREHHRTAIPLSLFEDYQSIQRALRITSAGIYLGKMYHNELKPSAELALNQFLSPEIQSMDLPRDAALNFLAHMNLNVDKTIPQGFVLVKYTGSGLGWLHVLRNGQIRNKYPTAWRILQRYPKV